MRRTLPATLLLIALLIGPAAVGAAGPIVVDHTCTDLSLIPDPWIEQARALTMHYAHTSHGSQIVDGIQWLQSRDAKYGVNVRTSTTPGLPSGTGILRIYDGQPGDTYVTPELYWATPDGVSRTRTVADAGVYDYSMWAWCGQQSSNSSATVNAYLAQMAAFEGLYPAMRYILMTGHTDGGSSTLAANNALVRQYAQNQDMVLYDFADIESHDPAGTYYPNATDACDWCDSWCNAHPADCASLPSYCAHSGDGAGNRRFNCVQKAKAFWWLMARLAGWPGPGGANVPIVTIRSVPGHADVGQVVSYTVTIRQPWPAVDTVSLNDVLPAGLSYVPSSLSATCPTVSDAAAPSLTWTGQLSPTPAVTVSYAALVTTAARQVLSNAAVVSVAGVEPITRSVALWANPEERFAPFVVKLQH